MNNKGQSAKTSGHLVILLSVIGLVAFSSAMKDLSQLHQFAHEAGSLVASWSHKADPVEITPAVVQVETCELDESLEQSIPSVELPWLGDVAEEKIEIKETVRSKRPRVQIVRAVRPPRVDFDPVQLEVRVPSEHDADFVTPADFPQFSFKTRTRKPNVIRISPRDREMILKTLNRSINLRIAS